MTEILRLILILMKRYEGVALPQYGTFTIAVKVHQGKPQSPRLTFEDTTDPTAEELRAVQ